MLLNFSSIVAHKVYSTLVLLIMQIWCKYVVTNKSDLLYTQQPPLTAATDGSVHGSGDSSVLRAGEEELIVIRKADIPDGAALSTYVMTL